MASEWSPPIYLYHDVDTNKIRAASVGSSHLLDDGFPGRIEYRSLVYRRLENVLMFWDHLSVDGQSTSPVRGIRLNLMPPDDTPILNSRFCTDRPSNMNTTYDFLHDIVLAPLPDDYGCDGAQAFGSTYFANGDDVILGLGGWAGIEYDFPIDHEVISAKPA